MYTKVYLTPFDQERLDPSARIRAKLHAMDVERFSPPSKYLASLKPEVWLQKYEYLLDTLADQHSLYVSYCKSLMSKFGPQGGSFGLKKLMQHYNETYLLAERPVQMKIVLVGRDYLIRLCRQLVGRVGMPQPYESTWVSTHAAIPTGLKKGTFYAETRALRKHLIHLQSDLPGMRRQRGKDRTINQDACENVRFIEDILNGIRLWAKNNISYFKSWCNPAEYVKPVIYKMIKSPFRALSFDFNHMDDHFSRKLALEVVLPIWEQLMTPAEYMHMSHFLNEAFEQPIYFGTYELTGIHNLLSGQSITNDIETWYAMCLLIGCVLEAGGDLSKWLLLALGDDTLAMTNKEQSLCDLMKQLYHEEANLNGVDVHEDKTDDANDHVIYLRRLYVPKGGIIQYNRSGEPYQLGAYPSILALNNIVQPERLSRTPGLAMCATLQRLDNVYGSPDYVPLVQLVFKHIRGLKLPTSEEVAEFSYTDWWNRLYDEPWDPSCSHTFNYLQKYAAGVLERSVE